MDWKLFNSAIFRRNNLRNKLLYIKFYILIFQNSALLNVTKRKIPPEKKVHSVFFRGFVAIVLDESPRSGDNTMLWSIYLGTSELFIYKCLTSRRRLASFFLLLSRLFSLFLLSSNLRDLGIYRCRCSKQGAKEGKVGKDDRTKVQRKEAERTNFRVARPTSRCRCNVAVVTKKEETRDIRKQKKKEKRESRKESRKRVDFVELTVSYYAEVKSDHSENALERYLWKCNHELLSIVIYILFYFFWS